MQRRTRESAQRAKVLCGGVRRGAIKAHRERHVSFIVLVGDNGRIRAPLRVAERAPPADQVAGAPFQVCLFVACLFVAPHT